MTVTTRESDLLQELQVYKCSSSLQGCLILQAFMGCLWLTVVAPGWRGDSHLAQWLTTQHKSHFVKEWFLKQAVTFQPVNIINSAAAVLPSRLINYHTITYNSFDGFLK